MYVWHIKTGADGINCVDLRRDIIIPDDVFHSAVGRFPRHNKHCDTLVNAIFDEAFFCRQIENIKTVNPRRKDNQRRFQHIFRRRIILNKLVQWGLVNHLALCRRDVFPKFECGGIGMRNLSALHVLYQVLHAGYQTCAVGFHRSLKRHWIGKGRIGRAHRLDYTAQGKVHLGLVMISQANQLIGGS